MITLNLLYTFKVAPSSTVKLLGVNIDKNLNFKFYIEKICKLVNNKTNALIRIRNFLMMYRAVKLHKHIFFPNSITAI